MTLVSPFEEPHHYPVGQPDPPPVGPLPRPTRPRTAADDRQRAIDEAQRARAEQLAGHLSDQLPTREYPGPLRHLITASRARLRQ